MTAADSQLQTDVPNRATRDSDGFDNRGKWFYMMSMIYR